MNEAAGPPANHRSIFWICVLALFNAVSRGIPVHITAIGALHTPGRSQLIVARKDLIDSGQLASYADLKGKVYARPAPLGIATIAFEKALQLGVRGGEVEHKAVQSLGLGGLQDALAGSHLGSLLHPCMLLCAGTKPPQFEGSLSYRTIRFAVTLSLTVLCRAYPHAAPEITS